jgi:hypothetical protein
VKNQPSQKYGENAGAERGLLAEEANANVMEPPTQRSDQPKGKGAHRVYRHEGIVTAAQTREKRATAKMDLGLASKTAEIPVADTKSGILMIKLI